MCILFDLLAKHGLWLNFVFIFRQTNMRRYTFVDIYVYVGDSACQNIIQWNPKKILVFFIHKVGPI